MNNKINNMLTSFMLNPLAKENNSLASKHLYNIIRYNEKPGRGAISSLAGLLVFLWVMVCPMGAWGKNKK